MGGEDFNKNALMQIYAVVINSVRKAQIASWIQGKETLQLVKKHEQLASREVKNLGGPEVWLDFLPVKLK